MDVDQIFPLQDCDQRRVLVRTRQWFFGFLKGQRIYRIDERLRRTLLLDVTYEDQLIIVGREFHTVNTIQHNATKLNTKYKNAAWTRLKLGQCVPNNKYLYTEVCKLKWSHAHIQIALGINCILNKICINTHVRRSVPLKKSTRISTSLTSIPISCTRYREL
jgi:hypothetical protein